MHPYDLNQFGIALDGDDPLDLSSAIASRGVLEAAAQSPDLLNSPLDWGEAIAGAVSSGSLTRWQLPGTNPQVRHGAIEPLSAKQLARAWRSAVVDPNMGARLALEPMPSGAWPRWFPWSGNFASIIANQRQGAEGHLRGGIASVVLTTALPSPGGLGQWPMRIGIFPSERAQETAAALRATSMVRRDLATVSILSVNDPQCDVMIAPFALREIRRRIQSYGFAPAAGVVVAPFDGLRNQTQRAVAVQYLNSEVGASVVATGMPYGGLEGRWVNELVRSLSHRNSFDVAMWEADGAVRQVLGPDAASKLRAPTIIGDADFLTESTLDRQVLRLADRIERLDQPLHFDATTASRLRLPEGGHPAAYVARTLRDNLPSISFLREDDAATGISELSQTVAAAEAAASVDTGVVTDRDISGRPPLFADVTFIDANTKRRVDDSMEALQVDREYLFEVALRSNRTGISHRGHPPKPVAPMPAAQDISLLVVIFARDADFDLPEMVQRIVLAAGGATESSTSIFRVTPQRTTPHASDLVAIEVRVYYEMNLLEFLEVSAEVVRSRQSSAPQLGLAVPIFVEQSSHLGRSQADLIAGMQPRHMGIDVRRVGDEVRFTFSLRTGEGDPQRSVVMQARKDVSLDKLGLELNRLRHIWEDIAVERIGNEACASDLVFRSMLRRLAIAGRDLRSLLFLGKKGGSLWTIGEWLLEHKLAIGSLIDVQLLNGATDFIFPWSMVYDLPITSSDVTADPSGFWGLRYSIAQRVPDWPYRSDMPLAAHAGGSRLEFMLWDSFPNGGDQVALLTRLANASEGRLSVPTPPIDNKKDFYRMVQKCEADILYFYTHGYTRPSEADSGYSVIARIKRRYEALPVDQQAASGLKPIYDLISSPDFDPDESWIGLSSGRLFLRDMRVETVNLVRSPIVFLNMCQSAQVMPGLTDSFVSFFLERNARSVLGTECPMTTAFAHPFSEQLFGEFLAGRQLGEALRRARCHFMAKKNPLGLAYSLFGSATVRYDPGIVPEEAM